MNDCKEGTPSGLMVDAPTFVKNGRSLITMKTVPPWPGLVIIRLRSTNEYNYYVYINRYETVYIIYDKGSGSKT